MLKNVGVSLAETLFNFHHLGTCLFLGAGQRRHYITIHSISLIFTVLAPASGATTLQFTFNFHMPQST